MALSKAGRVWNKTITNVLHQLQYEATEADNCLFAKTTGELAFVLLYVDNMLIVTNGDKEYERIRRYLEIKIGKAQPSTLHWRSATFLKIFPSNVQYLAVLSVYYLNEKYFKLL